jgi:ferric-dicitrate binding protein FerR (iron transport regulator)
MEAASSIRLAPTQQYDSAQGRARALSAAELEGVVSWRQGNLTFDGLTLADAAARIGAYHGCTITVAAEVAKLEPGGTFPLNDLPALLRARKRLARPRARQPRRLRSNRGPIAPTRIRDGKFFRGCPE